MIILRVAVLAAAAVAAGCEVNLGTEGLVVKDTRTYTVSGVPDLSLDTFDGSIEVHSWDRPEVEIEIEKRAQDNDLLGGIAVNADQQGDRIVVTVTGPPRSGSRTLTIGHHVSTEARLRVAMPRRATLNARTGDGPITVEAIDGRVILRTGDGRISAERVTGDIEARSGDGAIRLTRVEGRLDLETSDGSISVDGRLASLQAVTGDGTIRVRAEDGSAVDGSWNLSTRDGSIILVLPEAFAADIDAETGDGSIRSEHPGLTIEQGRERPRQLRARMGAGGALVKLRTGDGSIRFER